MIKMNRRTIWTTIGCGILACSIWGCSNPASMVGASEQTMSEENSEAPNFIIILCDDGPGYGDLGCYGSDIHNTAHIDKLASEGVRLTDFYQAAPCCTPTRASLLTGCYARRIGMYEGASGSGTLKPGDRKGLNPEERTIADVLKEAGYSTACIGKWHLGDQPEFMPRRQGFDYYFGLPYSNDMSPLPLIRNESVIDPEPDQSLLTQKYTEEACNFISENKDGKFFIYLAHSMVHRPLHASRNFKGRSRNGIYGDALEEIDWSVGQIMKHLQEEGLDDNTVVFLMADDGASGLSAGSNAPFVGHKGDTLEGGMRSPCIVRWPGHIAPSTTYRGLSTIMDILPTVEALAGIEPVSDKPIDGKNIWPYLLKDGSKESPHEAYYYYMKDQLQAVRWGKWKLQLPLEDKISKPWPSAARTNSVTKLVDLENDPREENDLSEEYPLIVERLTKLSQQAISEIGTKGQPGSGYRPAGWVSGDAVK